MESFDTELRFNVTEFTTNLLAVHEICENIAFIFMEDKGYIWDFKSDQTMSLGVYPKDMK